MPPRRRGPSDKRPVHWWSEGIADLRKSVLSCRRSYQRSLRRLGTQGSVDVRIRFLAARKELRLAIRIAKERCWEELCDLSETNPWGRPYRIVMKKFGGNNCSKASLGRESAIADHLFPAAPITNWDIATPAYTMNLFEAFDLDTDALSYELAIPPFVEAELQKACARLSVGKAGGPSSVPNEALKQLAKMRSH